MHGGTQRHEKSFGAVQGRCDVAHAANEDQLAGGLFGRGVGAGSGEFDQTGPTGSRSRFMVNSIF